MMTTGGQFNFFTALVKPWIVAMRLPLSEN
jgi:hypothetical protein